MWRDLKKGQTERDSWEVNGESRKTKGPDELPLYTGGLARCAKPDEDSRPMSGICWILAVTCLTVFPLCPVEQLDGGSELASSCGCLDASLSDALSFLISHL